MYAAKAVYLVSETIDTPFKIWADHCAMNKMIGTWTKPEYPWRFIARAVKFHELTHNWHKRALMYYGEPFSVIVFFLNIAFLPRFCCFHPKSSVFDLCIQLAGFCS